MKAVFKRGEVSDSSGNGFDKFVYTVEITGEMSVDFANRYFDFCKIKSKDLIGKQVFITLDKKDFETKDGKKAKYDYIKYLNVLDENGRAIIMKKDKPKYEEDKELPF